VEFLAHLDHSAASLRIVGTDLDPEEISGILSCQPTAAYRKGQIVVGKRSGQKSEKKSGLWLLKADKRSPGNLDAQIHELFDKLPSDLSIWSFLSAKYSMDLFCGLFMTETNEGLSISPGNLKALGERSILLALDIYGPTKDEADVAP
jgi:hypothetical protein